MSLNDSGNLSWLAGLQIAFADSNLESFVLTVGAGQTLTARSELRDGNPVLGLIAGTREREAARPAGPSAGCTVDWSWLTGLEICSARSDLRSLLLTLR